MAQTIYSYLKKDHQKVADLFENIIAASSQDEREKFFLEVEMELELHADPEKNTFYKALAQRKKGEEEAKHGKEEHKEMKAAIKKLKLIPSSEEAQWLVQFGVLKHIVEHHVKEEEHEMFTDAKKIISDKKAFELVEEIESLKQKKLKDAKFMEKFKELTPEQ